MKESDKKQDTSTSVPPPAAKEEIVPSSPKEEYSTKETIDNSPEKRKKRKFVDFIKEFSESLLGKEFIEAYRKGKEFRFWLNTKSEKVIGNLLPKPTSKPVKATVQSGEPIICKTERIVTTQADFNRHKQKQMLSGKRTVKVLQKHTSKKETKMKL